MELKKLIYNVSLGAVGLMFAACSDVAEDDRFIFVEPAEVAKRVLIEDLTGQRCINCPNGAAVIEQIMEDYGEDNIIAVGLYGGAMGYLPNGGPAMPLTCDESQWYYTNWGVADKPQPMARIDRGSFNSDYNTWATAVRERIQQKTPVLLDASCNYDEVSHSVEIKVTADGLQNVSGKLQVWLTEDSIISPQMLPGNISDTKYVHNHVFRATVNAPEGEDISIAEGENATRTFTYAVKDDWKPENMSVVTFIFDNSGVLQAAKAPLIAKAGDAETGDGETQGGGNAAQ